MTEAAQIYRCKICGGGLGWNPAVQKWKCRYCDAEFELQTIEEQGKSTLREENHEKENHEKEKKVNALRLYHCRYCGAEVITDQNTAATFCVYCSNPVVLEEQLVDDFAPDYVIPFRNTKEQAMEQYLAFIKKPFTPRAFLSAEHVEKIKGVYLPFWLYDAKVSGEVVVDCERIRRTRSSKTETIHHDIYQIIQGGEIEFDYIPVDASSKTDNSIMDSIEPFSFQDLKKFEMPYLAGFLAEKYDEDVRTCYPRAKVRAINTMKTRLVNSIKGSYNSVKLSADNLRLEKCKGHYALLPVWLLYTRYEDKDYLFAMNGQTGKMTGDIPIDKKIRMRYFLKYTGIIWAAATVIASLAALM